VTAVLVFRDPLAGHRPAAGDGGRGDDLKGMTMYENFKLCDQLEPQDTCIVIERYSEGEYRREFHEHIPRVRLSNDSRAQLLRALVIRFAPFSADATLRCHLNGRGRVPPADNTSLRLHVCYAEPGVRRSYCGVGNLLAWSDQVIMQSEFRPK
jgi:hypothetical protein